MASNLILSLVVHDSWNMYLVMNSNFNVYSVKWVLQVFLCCLHGGKLITFLSLKSLILVHILMLVLLHKNFSSINNHLKFSPCTHFFLLFHRLSMHLTQILLLVLAHSLMLWHLLLFCLYSQLLITLFIVFLFLINILCMSCYQ